MTGSYTEYQFINVYDQGYSVFTIISIMFLVLVVTFCIGVTVMYYYRKFNLRRRIRSLNASTQNIMNMMQMDEVTGETAQEEEPPFFFAQQSHRDGF